MPIGYVLINTETAHMESVLEALKKIDAVKEAHMVYGVYDIIVEVETDNMDRLKEIVTYHIRRLDEVQSTITLIAME
ncbi:MAG: Lrp/AsnC ligand binding domain-containing protein [Candidatus Bathyarchaeota archaeon]|nr:MAG: Lrp/AsnC ligand binding domain-containing protein [Candidatus Bathyarchaeota archaeon]